MGKKPYRTETGIQIKKIMEQIKEGQQINLGLRKAELESFHAPKQLSGFLMALH